MSETPIDKKAKALADQLLEAQVEFWLKNLTGKKFISLLDNELNYIYDQLDSITLNEAVSEEKVRQTALRYAVEMEIGGGIPELFGQIASQIFEFPANQTTTLLDIFPEDVAVEYFDKVFEPEGLLDFIVKNIRNSPAFRNFLSDLVLIVLKGYLLDKNIFMKVTGVATSTKAVRDWVSSKAPELSESLQDKLRQLTDSGVTRSLNLVDETLSDEHYRQVALNSTLNLWDSIKNSPIANFQEYVSEQDLQEFLVMGYEFWLRFRESDYLRSCIDFGVSFFFEKYGDESLITVINEMGVTKDMVMDEFNNYFPDLAQLMIDKGMAETILRKQLKRFYQQKQTLTILGSA